MTGDEILRRRTCYFCGMTGNAVGAGGSLADFLIHPDALRAFVFLFCLTGLIVALKLRRFVP